MQRNFCTARSGEPVSRALARLSEDACKTMLVLDGEELAGVLSSENLGEFVMIQAALQESQRRS